MEAIRNSIDSYVKDNYHIFNEEIQNIDRYRYNSFGTDFEGYIAPLIKNYLEAIFPDIQVNFARTKIDFPDITVKYNGETMALDIKCCSHWNKTPTGEWRQINHCNTDLGTLREIEQKIKKFDSIVYFFAEYSCTDKIRCIHEIHVRPFYEFIGTSQNGRIIRYRKKDGNIRPANFKQFNNSHFTSLKQFVDNLVATNIYRDFSIAEERLQLLNNKIDNRKFFHLLKLSTEGLFDEKLKDFMKRFVDKLEQRENIIENGTGATAPARGV
jgi:hypothetical protein